ncbi:hypothetical protein Patl1_34296 [Pistacia atlantica]|uniref:Uncharacterized protein n=1 Tax=Pistacia atlantica TaxID=434234 RepID=A0ACC0ZSX0_9ROSI|nr:hypothetical protein Patl1_34296 [Pistacia atlantica]
MYISSAAGKPRIVHRDVKSANILLDENWEAKLNEKADVYSFGMLLLELITGCLPTNKIQPSDSENLALKAKTMLRKAVKDNKINVVYTDPKLEKKFDNGEMFRMVHCAAACLCYPAKDRPQMSQIREALEGKLDVRDLTESIKTTLPEEYISYGITLVDLITGRGPLGRTHSIVDDSVAGWARPLLAQAMENCNFVALVDPRLIEYNSGEMDRMVACAATSIRLSAEHHPRMSQIVQALEGNMSLDDLSSGIPPGNRFEYGGSKQEMEGIKWNKTVDIRTSEHCSENWTGRFDLLNREPVQLQAVSRSGSWTGLDGPKLAGSLNLKLK